MRSCIAGRESGPRWRTEGTSLFSSVSLVFPVADNLDLSVDQTENRRCSGPTSSYSCVVSITASPDQVGRRGGSVGILVTDDKRITNLAVRLATPFGCTYSY